MTTALSLMLNVVGDYDFINFKNYSHQPRFNFKPKTIVTNYGFNFLKKFQGFGNVARHWFWHYFETQVILRDFIS